VLRRDFGSDTAYHQFNSVYLKGGMQPTPPENFTGNHSQKIA
jgi:hypothetical protein